MTHQPFIASYRKDFEWLGFLLRSLKKFGTGFMEPVVVVPSDDLLYAKFLGLDNLATFREKDGPGFGRAQAAMMECDVFCPDADYIYLFGSDNFATDAIDPMLYWRDGKPMMMWDTPEGIKRHERGAFDWLAGTKRALGVEPSGEFMRQLPLVYPRGLYRNVRDAVSLMRGASPTPHHQPESRSSFNIFDKYVTETVNSNGHFSESNVLGEYAFRFANDQYTWVCLENCGSNYKECMGPNPVIQFWSWGGLDRPYDGWDNRHKGRTPRSIIDEKLV